MGGIYGPRGSERLGVVCSTQASGHICHTLNLTSNYFNINLKVKAKTVVPVRLTLGLLEACFQVLHVSCELLNLLRCSNPSSGPKFATRWSCARL